MTRHYWVNSEDTSDITGPFVVGRAVTDSSDNVVTGNLRGPAPALGIYLATEDNTPTPEYNTRLPDTLTFTGAVGSDAARVVEQRNFEQQPIETVYQQKTEDIARQDQAVRYNTFDTSRSVNWWVVCFERFRFELNGIQGNWLQRQVDGQGWPGGANRPWVTIYNAANETVRREQVTSDTDWETIYLELTQHDQQCGNATNASGNALDAAYNDGAGDWQAVADHDPADPAWGYPPTAEISETAIALMGGR